CLRRDFEPCLPVGDDRGRAAGVGRDQYRLLREESLERYHPEVLVDRRVVDGEAASVEVGELCGGDPPGEPRPPVETALPSERLQPETVRALTRDDDLERRVERSSLQEEVDPLGPV